MIRLGLDIGSNSVGSAWIDARGQTINLGVSIFPAGVDETDDQRGEPKNAKRRQTRRTRITLARRAMRKRLLRRKLMEVGLLPTQPEDFKLLLESTDPWELRRRALDQALTPHEFGRVLLHLAQRRGALGLKIVDPEEAEKAGKLDEDGKVKAAIGALRLKMLEREVRTLGEYIAILRAERATLLSSPDNRPPHARKGLRVLQGPVRNKAGSYEHCADRAMVRAEFALLWETQRGFGGDTARILATLGLREALDHEARDSTWQHKGLLFGQRRQSWDMGTLGRCVLEPSERCVPHADMDASRYRVVETINNLKIIERGKEARFLTQEERQKIKDYLSGPLGMDKPRKVKGQTRIKPKTTVSVSDLRILMGWGRASKTSLFRFNIEADENRTINTDWFSREIIHGAVTPAVWNAWSPSVRDGINRAILKYDPDRDGDAEELKACVMKGWAGLNETQAEALVAAWRQRPKLDAKRLNMSRRAARNLLELMDRSEPWPDPERPGQWRWLTPIAARKLIAEDADFVDVTTGNKLDAHTRRRYATGAKGATARDRHYMKKHILLRHGQPILGPDGKPLSEPPPAPTISNPVVRKAIHEVRRHLIEYMTTFSCKPDAIHVELAREARMGKKDADAILFRNRLRNRIRRDIVQAQELEFLSSTQQRAAVDRVILCVQQGGVCPLCGNQTVPTRITPPMAAEGRDCEVAHILPRSRGGPNGLNNLVLAHTQCNREMGRRTPREFWNHARPDGFDGGMRMVEGIYGDIERPKFSEIKTTTADALWSCYFNTRDDQAKLAQFAKDIRDIQDMTPGQKAATQYAARQVMAYLADALYDGQGLPERGGDRLIFANDGLWTHRLRREWGLFFDPHEFKAKGLSPEETRERKEKNRGDHRHHAIDAVVVALCTRDIQLAWEQREKQAEIDGINPADEVQMDNYRRNNPLNPPPPYKSREELREAVRRAVYGEGTIERPVCHRPVKRKLIGALHEETLLGPVLDPQGALTSNFTARKNILELDSNHLRLPSPESDDQAVKRLTQCRLRVGEAPKAARQWARTFVASSGYHPRLIDPPPGKSGVVRDIALRRRLRECLSQAGLDPDNFKANDLKKLVEAGGIKHASGVPIKSFILLRTMNDPVLASRWTTDYATGQRRKLYDAVTGQGDARAARAYVSGNNHHIEIRVVAKPNGQESWTGVMVTAYEAAQRKLARLRAMREAGIPKPATLRTLPAAERAKYKSQLRAIEQAHPIVDRTDHDARDGRFVMSLSEGEMLLMRRKTEKGQPPGEVGYFVVAKLDAPQTMVLVPHWDARPATLRKDETGQKIPDSNRTQFSVTPTDLKLLAPPDHPHAPKVRVSPLGKVRFLPHD